MLARLDTQQQALILGHAVPMPVVVRTRNYDVDLYRSLGFAEPEEVQGRSQDGIEALF